MDPTALLWNSEFPFRTQTQARLSHRKADTSIYPLILTFRDTAKDAQTCLPRKGLRVPTKLLEALCATGAHDDIVCLLRHTIR